MLLPGGGRGLLPWLPGLDGDTLFCRPVSCPLLPELSFPELTPVIAFSFNVENGGYGLYYETRLFCSI